MTTKQKSACRQRRSKDDQLAAAITSATASQAKLSAAWTAGRAFTLFRFLAVQIQIASNIEIGKRLSAFAHTQLENLRYAIRRLVSDLDKQQALVDGLEENLSGLAEPTSGCEPLEESLADLNSRIGGLLSGFIPDGVHEYGMRLLRNHLGFAQPIASCWLDSLERELDSVDRAALRLAISTFASVFPADVCEREALTLFAKLEIEDLTRADAPPIPPDSDTDNPQLRGLPDGLFVSPAPMWCLPQPRLTPYSELATAMWIVDIEMRCRQLGASFRKFAVGGSASTSRLEVICKLEKVFEGGGGASTSGVQSISEILQDWNRQEPSVIESTSPWISVAGLGVEMRRNVRGGEVRPLGGGSEKQASPQNFALFCFFCERLNIDVSRCQLRENWDGLLGNSIPDKNDSVIDRALSSFRNDLLSHLGLQLQNTRSVGWRLVRAQSQPARRSRSRSRASSTTVPQAGSV